MKYEASGVAGSHWEVQWSGYNRAASELHISVHHELLTHAVYG